MKDKTKQLKKDLNKIKIFLEKDIWRIPLKELSPKKSFLIKQLRILLIAFRGFNEDKVRLQASALTYYTLLSIIPVIAMGFGIAQGFGLEAYLERQLEEAFAGREEVFVWITEFSHSLLDKAQGGIIAGAGMIILLFTVMKVMNNIEKSFNSIWQISKPRPWSRKFSDYFSMMFIAPIFLILAGSATVFLTTQIEIITKNFALLGFISPVLLFLVQLIPYTLIWIMLTIVYMVMPNTNVKFSSALIAGIVAGTLFQLTQWGYIHFQIGVSKYNAIYGSFAAFPLLLIWMQISWLIILFGAEISFANQNVQHYEFESESLNISPHCEKIMSLYVLNLLVKNFHNEKPPLTSWEISSNLNIPNKLIRKILHNLTKTGLIVEAKGHYAKEIRYQPGIDINKISISYAIEKLEKHGYNQLMAKPSKILMTLTDTLESFNNSMKKSNKNILLKDL